MLNKTSARVLAVSLLVAAALFASVISAAWSSSRLTEYPTPSIVPTIYLQGTPNWCGPGVLQSAIEYTWRQYNSARATPGTPTPTPYMIPKATLWAYMRDNTCNDVSSSGRDAALPGTVGDGNSDVRKMNIAYDFGVDPHAMAWTMWKKTPAGFYYHYWVYDNVTDATRYLLWPVEKYHEPVLAAVQAGSHWVLVIGYDSDNRAYPGDPGTIRRIRIVDPLDASQRWYSYSSWTTYWFTPYTDSRDPDPGTGWYIPPPDHWRNKWVTIERDENSSYNADWGMRLYGPAISHQPLTYLPDIKTNDGWNSTIVIRNNSSSNTANVTLTYYDASGGPVDTLPSTSISANGTLAVSPPNNFSGSAVVAASQDMSVVVREEKNNELDIYNGILASGGSLGWERVGSTLYAPVVKDQHWGRSSRLFIFNPNTTAVTANIQFYPSGSPPAPNIPANGRSEVLSTNCGTTLCSAVITTTQSLPLAVVVLEQNDGTLDNPTIHNAVSAGATTNFAPVVKKNYGSQTTALEVQNLGGQFTNVSVTCYYMTTGSVPCGSPTGLASKATVVFNMSSSSLLNGFFGSAVVSNSAGQTLATVIHESGTPYKLVANAPLAGTATAYAPELYGNYLQSGQTWNSGLHVQNVGSGNANVTVTYYNLDGSAVPGWTRTSTIGQYRMWLLSWGQGNMPNFLGSAVITSNQPVVAVVNTNHGGSGDTKASYTAPNR